MPELRIVEGPDRGAVFHFTDLPLTVGRDEGCSFQLLDMRDNPVISREHFRIDLRDGLYRITDLSLNGVFIDGRSDRLPKRTAQPLINGQRLLIADYVLEFRAGPPPAPVSSVRAPAGAASEAAAVCDGDDWDWDDQPADPPLRGNAPAAPVPPAGAAAVIRPQQVSPDCDRLLARFLDGAGLSASSMRPDVMPDDILFMAGRLCRENLEGLHLLLDKAAAVQRDFPAAGLSVVPGARHPFLRTGDMSRLLGDLLAPPRRAGPPADQVTRLTFQDLARCQWVLSRVCEQALDIVTDSLNPERIRRQYIYQRSGLRKIFDKMMIILCVKGKFEFFWSGYIEKWNKINHDKSEKYDSTLKQAFELISNDYEENGDQIFDDDVSEYK